MGIDAIDMVLFYADRMDTGKHVHTLIEALLCLPDEPHPVLVMAGNGPLLNEINDRAARITNQYALPSVSDKDRVAEPNASSDIYVSAGPHVVAAFSVVEAQAIGLLCVGVNAGGL